jgi:hypothetical protein
MYNKIKMPYPEYEPNQDLYTSEANTLYAITLWNVEWVYMYMSNGSGLNDKYS